MNNPAVFLRGTPGLPERQAVSELPAEIRLRGIFILPTREGVIFFAMLLALLFGSVNHNNNLGFILTFLLGAISLVSIFHTCRNLSGLTVLSAGAEPVFASQSARFEIKVATSGVARHGLRFFFDGEKPAAADLHEESNPAVQVSHATWGRGLLRPGRLHVSTTYPLGLFRARAELFPDISCLVYPKPVAGPFISGHTRDRDHSEGGNSGAGVEDFAGLDSYQPGDSLQHISWKTFSRGQGLHTKKFQGQRGRTYCFDPEILPGRDLESKLSRICYMILMAEAQQTAYGLRLGGDFISPGLGGAHKRKCLRALALAGGSE
jgi:uncharacterized protein (DUF58 family)